MSLMRIAILSLVALGGGCAATSEAPAPSSAPVIPGLPLSELPAQPPLARGQCALTLWSRDASGRLLVMALDRPAVARVSLNGQVRELALADQVGEPFYGHAPRQTFVGEGLSLTLSFTPVEREGLVGGGVAGDAALELTEAGGDTLFVPAAGLLACQP